MLQKQKEGVGQRGRRKGNGEGERGGGREMGREKGEEEMRIESLKHETTKYNRRKV